MLCEQLIARDIRDPLVLDAMSLVPREQFVLAEDQNRAYEDCALPIGYRQTISQPYIVALMLELAQVTPESSVLDIGTGCGYMAAILAKITRHVCTLERIPELATMAQDHFHKLQLNHIDSRVGDGYQGWPEKRSFDAILISCASDRPPEKLTDQLNAEGTIVMPISTLPNHQILTSYHKEADGSLTSTQHTPVRFVPMV